MTGSPAPVPLFIIGSPRSGTTFLTRLVNRFLDYRISRDAGLFLRFYRLREHYGDLAAPGVLERLVADLYEDYFFQLRFCRRGLTLDAATLIARMPSRTWPALVDTVLQAVAETKGKTGYGNKKPSYALLTTEEVDALFPRARWVHIIRDGRDVALSMRRAKHLLVEKNWFYAASDWRDHVAEGRAFAARVGADRYLEITYEGLMRDPVATVSTMLTFLQAPPAQFEALDRVRTNVVGWIKSSNTDKWKTEMPPEAIRTVEQVAGEWLRDLGYPLMYPDVVGQPFSTVDLQRFKVDRLVRNLFQRSMSKFVRFKTAEAKSEARARLGTKSDG